MLRATLMAGLLLFATTGADAADAVRPEPIRFQPGTSTGTVKGAVARGEQAVYGLRARAGQEVTIQVAAAGDNAAFQAYAPGAAASRDQDGLTVTGTALPGAGEGDDAKRWSGKMPASGELLLVVGAIRGGTGFSLTVAIR